MERIRSSVTRYPDYPFCTQVGYGSSTGANETIWQPLTKTVKVIRDIKEPYNPTGKYPWHPASHVRVNCIPGTRDSYTVHDYIELPLLGRVSTGISEVVTYSGLFQHYGWMALPELTAGIYCTPLTDHPGVLPGDVAAEMSRKAIQNVTEQVPTEVSIANFLFELKDGLKSILPKFKGNFVQDLIAGNWLWWNFGALPLVSDIKKLCNMFQLVDKRLEHLQSVNKRLVTIVHKDHWSGPVTDGAADDRYNLSPVYNNGVLFNEVSVRINIRAYYDLDLSGADVFFKGLVSALGLDKPGSIIWEAIPFSFVVDWFTNASEWIDDNIDTSQPFKGTIAMHGSDYTLRQKLMIGGYTAVDNLAHGDKSQVDQALVRVYHRRAGLPEGQFAIDGLTPLQQSLGLALLAQGVGSFPFRRR